MKAEAKAEDCSESATGKAQRIICGGGWKNPPKEYSLKIKAFIGVFLTIAAAFAGIYYYQDYGLFVFLPSVVLLIATTSLFFFEHPTTFLGPQDGDHDIHNLYGRSGDHLKIDGRNEPDDHKVA
jgi:hypothetical protein